MSRADTHEVDAHILAPLRACLGLGRQDPHATGANAVLQSAGWRRTAVARWRVSRQVDLDATFSAAELQRLKTVPSRVWQAIAWPQGADAAVGEALTYSLAQLPALACLDAADSAYVGMGAAFAAFVDATQLAAPGLLRQALVGWGASPLSHEGATLQLRSQSNAYNRPQQYLDEFRREAVTLDDHTRPSFVARLHAEEAETRAAMVLATDDPFLDPPDRLAHRDKLARIYAALQALRLQHGSPTGPGRKVA